VAERGGKKKGILQLKKYHLKKVGKRWGKIHGMKGTGARFSDRKGRNKGLKKIIY